MKKVLLSIFILLMGISLVFGAQGDNGVANSIQSNTETQNQGANDTLQNQGQVKVQSGNYISSNGEQMQIQTENGFKLNVGGIEASSSLEIIQEQDQIQNRTKLKTQLSNGENAEIKVMPNTASDRAIERLQLKNCNSENNCSVQLKEVGTGEQVRAAYEVKAEKEAKILALFRTRMEVMAQIDAETGEIIQAKKPWWAFLAAE